MTWIRNVADTELGKTRRVELCDFLTEFVTREQVAASRAEIAEALGISVKTVQKHVTILIKENVLEDLGGTRGLRLKP